MNIELCLNRNFETKIKQLSEKYGPNFEKINGFAKSNLDLSSFIDNFIDSKNTANATIDANANVQSKDIVNLIQEINKPYLKLLGFNKLFYEMEKKYGLTKAKQMLEAEWKGDIFIHNASDISFRPYSYRGTEVIIVIYKGKRLLTTFSQLFDLVEEPEQLLSEKDNAWCKYTNELFVEDIVEDKLVTTPISRVIRKPKTEAFHFIKTSNGFTEIVTENHPVITKTRGDVEAKNILCGDLLTTISSVEWKGTIDTIYACDYLKAGLDNEKQNKIFLTKELGYVVGMYITDGTRKVTHGDIYQKESIKDRLGACLEACSIPYTGTKNLKIGNSAFAEIIQKVFLDNTTPDCKVFNASIINFNINFIKGLIAGFIDGAGTIEDNQLAFTISGNSRGLLNQLAYMLRAIGYLPRFKNPAAGLEWFKLYCSLYNNSAKISSVKIESLDFNNLPSFEDASKYADNQLSYTDDLAYVCENLVLKENDDDFVYDISVDTGHFLCNNILSHNCFNYDLEQLATKGMFFISNIKTYPAKHLTTFCDHVLEFISFISNRQSGASGIANVLMWFYWFWKNDIKNNHYIKTPEYYRDQCFQKFIFDLNMPYLRIAQCAYTNISLYDKAYCEEMFGGHVYPDGTMFIDCIDEFMDFQKRFLELFADMRINNVFTFPVLTYCLVYRDNKFQDEDFARWASNHNMKWADSNFLISPDTTSAASCCRLLSNTEKLKGVMNSIGGSSLDIGSCVVTTSNIAGLAYQAKNKKDFFSLLNKNIRLIIETNDVVRGIIHRNIKKGILPSYTYNLMKMERQFNTIGINGIWEAAKHFGLIKVDEFDYHNYTEEGIKFASEILDKINEIKDSYDFDYSINIEQTPMENGAIKLAKKNNLLYNSEEYITANQWIALKDKATIDARTEIAGILDSKCGGGCITHVQIDSPFASEEQAWKMLNHIASKGVIYFAFNLKINIDTQGHTFTSKVCPICGDAPADTYQRIVGYLVPSKSWSTGRQQELTERDWMNLNDIIL